jgi:hypothetical protein
MKKAGKVLGILGGIILFYLSISMVSFIMVDLIFSILGVLGILGAGAAIIGNTYVEGKRLKPILLIGAPCAGAVIFGATLIPAAVSGSLKLANDVTFIILGVMLLTFIMLFLSAVFALKKGKA